MKRNGFLHFILILSIFCTAQAKEYSVIGEDLLPPESQKALMDQEDFYSLNSPIRLLKQQRTDPGKIRVSSHFDVSMFSDDLVKTSEIDLIYSGKRYHEKPKIFNVSGMLPSNLGPTGLLDSISARGLPRGKASIAYVHTLTEVKQKDVFLNVSDYDGTDVNLILNYGFAQNFEVHSRFMKTTRNMNTSLGTNFNSAEDGFPEYSYGLKAHQNWLGKEFALGFINSNINASSRNLILDQEFEGFKSVYVSMTSDIADRTESHFTVKRNTADQKFTSNNSWFSFVGGVDTRLTSDTHLLGELKYENYSSPTKNWSLSGGLRHKLDDTNLELFLKRANQRGWSSLGFKVSGAF